MADIVLTGDDGSTIQLTTTEAPQFVLSTPETPAIQVGGVLTGPKGDKGDTGTGIPTGGTSGQVLAKNSATDYDTHWVAAGSGDMTKAVYDPTHKAADAFSMDNMSQGTTNKYITASEKTVLDATSGTNTGDETATTIKTKLGITTLSGSNTGDQDLSGLVPKTTTVNSHALSSNITLTNTDVGAAAASHTHAESDVTNLTTDLAGKVPTSRKVNGHALTADVTVTADDVLPAQTGNSGKYLTTNGTTSSWASVASGSSTLASDTDVSITSPADKDVLTYSSTAGKWQNQPVGSTTVPDATTTSKGIIQLAGDLGGTAAAPTVTKTYTTADVADSLDKRYVTDAQRTVISNTSGTNTGDQTTITGNAGSATKLQTARTINGVSFDGTANITVADSTKVPTTTTVNGHALSANVTVTANDVLPAQTGNSGKYLTTDGTNSSWATVTGGGTGNVTGPASSTAGDIATFSDTTGKVIQDSGKTLPTGNILGDSDTQTLTNKTLTAPIISASVLQAGDFQGKLVYSTANSTLMFGDGTSNHSLTTNDSTQTLTNKTLTAPVLSGTVTGTYTLGGTPTFPSTVVTTTGTQTLTNKTLTSPVISTIVNTGTLTLPTATGTLALTSSNITGTAAGITGKTTPTGALVGTTDTQTLSNKTLDNSNTVTTKATKFTIQDDTDTTKQVKFVASGITTGTTKTLTIPNASTTLVGTDAVQSLTNKTFTDSLNMSGQSGLPGSPATGVGMVYGYGTGAVRPHYMNSSGTDETILTNANSMTSGAAVAKVATAESTSSTTYTDLATVGPSVTVNVGPSGIALVSVGVIKMLNNTSSQETYMGFAISGASTVAASDTQAIMVLASSGSVPQVGLTGCFVVTGLTPGSNTFTAKYRVTGGTGVYQNRSISVVPL